MGRKILSVIVALIVAFAVMLIVEMLNSTQLAPPSADILADKAKLAEYMANGPVQAYVVVLIGYFLASFAGGFIVTKMSHQVTQTMSLPWPVPPMDLEPGEVPSDIRAEYMLSMKERLEQLDLSLRDDDTAAAAESIYRHVHTMKGAASAVGDEVTTWFCHGLERRMKQAIGGDRSLEEGLAEVGRHRATLSALLDDPRGTLDVLKSRGTRPEPRPRGTTRPAEDDRDADTIRIDRSSVDTLLDGFSVVGAVRDGIGARATADARQARELRRLRGDLADALRLIGPPRPWGAPAAALRRIERVAVGLARAADDLERRGADGREADVDLRDLTQAARKELLSMRQTPVRDLFAKVAAVITSGS